MLPDLIILIAFVIVFAGYYIVTHSWVQSFLQSWRTEHEEEVNWWELPVLEQKEEPQMPSISNAQAAVVGSCAACDKDTRLRCGRCKQVRYCSEECQQRHWKAGHKLECKPSQASNNVPNLGPAAAKPQPTTDALLAAATLQRASPAPVEADEVAPVPKKVLFPYSEFLSLFKSRGVCSRAPVGLANCGNTCFANSLFQCLLYTRPLAAYLLSERHTYSCTKPDKSAWCLVCELESLALKAKQAAEAGQREVSPRPITNKIRKIAPHFVPGRQEDTHELLVSLLDSMEAILLHEQGGRNTWDLRSRETSFVGLLFYGYMRMQTICSNCNHASQRFDTKVCLEISLSPQVVSMDSALAAFFEDEVLDVHNKYKCEQCNIKVCAVRASKIEVAPNVLVVHLKRFDPHSRFTKNNKMVTYEDMLDLGPYMAPNAMDSVPATYTLYGLVVHLNAMNSTMFGHYISYVKAEDGCWFKCDDSHITEVTAEVALSQKAYLLFYLRNTPRRAPDPKYCPAQPTKAHAAASPASHGVTAHVCEAHSADKSALPVGDGIVNGVVANGVTYNSNPQEGMHMGKGTPAAVPGSSADGSGSLSAVQDAPTVPNGDLQPWTDASGSSPHAGNKPAPGLQQQGAVAPQGTSTAAQQVSNGDAIVAAAAHPRQAEATPKAATDASTRSTGNYQRSSSKAADGLGLPAATAAAAVGPAPGISALAHGTGTKQLGRGLGSSKGFEADAGQAAAGSSSLVTPHWRLHHGSSSDDGSGIMPNGSGPSSGSSDGMGPASCCNQLDADTMRLYVELPEVQKASEIELQLVPPGQLDLHVPGRYQLKLPLQPGSRPAAAAAAAPAAQVAAGAAAEAVPPAAPVAAAPTGQAASSAFVEPSTAANPAVVSCHFRPSSRQLKLTLRFDSNTDSTSGTTKAGAAAGNSTGSSSADAQVEAISEKIVAALNFVQSAGLLDKLQAVADGPTPPPPVFPSPIVASGPMQWVPPSPEILAAKEAAVVAAERAFEAAAHSSTAMERNATAEASSSISSATASGSALGKGKLHKGQQHAKKAGAKKTGKKH